MKTSKRILSVLMAVLMVLSCWVWKTPMQTSVANAADGKDHYLFAYFTGNSSDGQTVHLAVSKDGLHYDKLRYNEPVIIPAKGTGAIRDPYLWYDEEKGYYYIICTDMDADIASDPKGVGYWWDNSDAFIMWRSKDLVHWVDETYINVKDLLNQQFNANVGDVYRAWAPQIMHDGESYMLYFSLITDNATYNSDNLAIVYLKTSDLMNLSKYTDFGTILDPGANIDVNDADIIKHPSNGKWYLFYKTETARIDSYPKIKMMVADRATGPYTSADTSNNVGLDVFSGLNEWLEGGNGFFDNEGNFVLYADAYMHNGNANTPYFYVAKTPANGDFTSWTIYGEDSHNINSLSPRHGSVVKISEAEYNNLLNNTYSISSSTFPESETLTDHLVARYFTTNNVNYNAATGNNDLNISGSLTTIKLNRNGISYYAGFTGSQYATVDLNALLPDSFNYDDGFTITFKAKPAGNNDSRFFQILGANSYSTEIACWGGKSGLYATYSNTTQVLATTSSYFNDGSYHDYQLSYANGNLIVYVDGNLVLKKNRFNSPTSEPLQQTPLMDDAWYEALGNGTLSIGALVSGGAKIVADISDFCIYDCAMSYYDIKKIQRQFANESGLTTKASIVVPETIYMTPSSGETKTGQYYVNNFINKETKEVELEHSPDTTKAYVEFYLPGAKDVKIAVDTIAGDIGDIVLHEAEEIADGNLTGTYEGNSLGGLIDEDGYFSYRTAGLYIKGTGLKAGKTAVAEWVFTITMDDDTTRTAYAYSTLYSPWYQPVGAAAKAKGAWHNTFASSILWVSGVHGYSDGDSNSRWYVQTANFMPMLGIIKAPGNNNPETHWIQSGSNGLSPTVNYQDVEAGGTKYHARANSISPTANITVDTSRYKNFNQIPNFTVGFMVTDREGTNDKGSNQWYVSDFTGQKDSYYNGTATGSSQYTGDWNNAGTKFSEGSDRNTGVKYNSVWNKAISGTASFRIKGAVKSTYQATITSTGWNNNFVNISVTGTNKSDLRDVVLEGAAYAKENYTEESWNNYLSKLRIAAEELGTPASVAQDSTIEALTAARDALQTRVTLDANGGTANVKYKDVTVGTSNTCIVTLSDCTATLKGYTFEGWSAIKDTVPASKIELGGLSLMPTVYAYWTENTYNVFFAPGIDANYDEDGRPGVQIKYTSSTTLEPFNGTDFTRWGYEFAGWNTKEDGSGTAIEDGATLTGEEIINLYIGLGGTDKNEASLILYAQWEKLPTANVTFDNLIDISEWKKVASNGSVTSVTDTGFTITSNAGVSESTSSSPYFPVEPGKQYKVEADVTIENPTSGSDWDIYIFFCDANGTWIDFVDGAPNRYSETTQWGNTFTAPNKTNVVKAQIRLDANGANKTVRFENIRVYEYDGTEVIVTPFVNKQVFTNSAYGELPEAYKDGYNFVGWFDENGTYITAETLMTSETTVNLKSKWVVSTVVLDFDAPVEIPLVDGLTAEAAEGVYGSTTVTADTVTYTPDTVLLEPEFIDYNVTIGGDTKEFTLKVFPASNVLYNEDKLTVTGRTDVPEWTATGDSKVTAQSISGKDDVYGYDESLNSATGFSSGTALKVDVDSGNTRSQTLTFSYTGNAFDLYGSCGDNTGIYIVTIRNGSKIEKVYITDTYFADEKLGTITQTPIIHHENANGYGEYTVEITSAWLASMVGQRTTFGLRGRNDDFGFCTADISEEAKEAILSFAEMEYLLDEDIEVTFCDENSIFNGGTGVDVASGFGFFAANEGTEASRYDSLTNYIDGFRVYQPLGYHEGMYIESEQGAVYNKVAEILIPADELNEAAANGVVFVEKDGEEIGTYESNGPKNEIYLLPKQSIAFNVTATSPNAKAMISLRALNNNATVTINGDYTATTTAESFDITTATEMYYKINNITFDGDNKATITIANTGDEILVISTLKLANGLSIAPMMMSAMPRVRMMLAAPAEDADPNAPVLPEPPEEVTTEETTTEETTTEETTTEETTTEETTTEEITTEEVTTKETTAEETTTAQPENSEIEDNTETDFDIESIFETLSSMITKLIEIVIAVMTKVLNVLKSFIA